ncbi:fibronectin type III domain-containing protein [uncultured Algibacter sp.]|uniref:fibronectin type III domain-containing protein n=1 Tax=uncultured Algibacter sp. TaxID=298659 RepID=UPI0032164027
MKQLVFFLLLSSFTYSQNYHYAIDRTKDTQPPSVPSNLTSSNTTETSTTISWDAATDNINVTNYQVYNNGILLVNSTGGISTTFVLTGLNPSTDYSLTIRAIDAAGNISGDSNIENFTTNSATIADTTPPSNPLNLEVSNISETSADLTWSVSTDNLAVIDYQVYNNGTLIIASTGGVDITTTLTGLNPGTDYNISVRAIDAAGNISGDSNNVEFTTAIENTTVNLDENLKDEIAFFSAKLLPIASKDSLQYYLDTYKSVRLEKGDYNNRLTINMSSNQKLFGHPSISFIPNINVVSGSDGIWIESVDSEITMESGAPIKNSTFKSLITTRINGTNVQLEDNTFINLSRTPFIIDCSSGGYMRNNKFIKHLIQGNSPMIHLRGNDATPSYGNVNVWINFLTAAGDAGIYENMGDLNIIGIDGEAWNFSNKTTTNAMVYARKMKDFKIGTWSGAAGFAINKKPVFDIEAENLHMIYKTTTSHGGGKSKITGNTNVFLLDGKHEGYDVNTTSAGFNFQGHFDNDDTFLNGNQLRSEITDITSKNKLKETILGTKHKPWDRYEYEKLPNPTGENWANERLGKTDKTSYIQNLIDTNNIAELDEGIYYIASTLKLKANQGIVGMGTGKTAIVGLTDDFPLITAADVGSGKIFTLSNMTLQGGSKGIFFKRSEALQLQLTSLNFKYLVFRNQKNGIHFFQFYGLDNSFFDYVNFVNCDIGLFQQPDYRSLSGGETDVMMYIDKCVFYRCQFINNNIAMSLLAHRANNLNGWVECNFKGNKIAADIQNSNTSFFANCDFSENTGEYVIGRVSETNFYSCNFSGNTANDILKTDAAYIEGCNFTDNINLFSDGRDAESYIINSTITGDVGNLKKGMIVNSNMLSNPNLSKTLVDIKDGNSTILINDSPNPYPQYLIKH